MPGKVSAGLSCGRNTKMAVSIKELIEKKEELANRKKRKYDIETSAGMMTVKLPTRSYVAEVMKLEGSDELLLLDCIVDPDLKEAGLQEAYGCLEPTDIIGKLFDAGEIPGLGRKVMELAGYGRDIRAALHEDAKN